MTIPERNPWPSGGRRKLYNEFTKYYLAYQIKQDEINGTCSVQWRAKKFVQNGDWIARSKRPLVRRRRRWEDNIEMGIGRTGLIKSILLRTGTGSGFM